MLELTVSKNECGLHEATATLTIPAITVTRAKADRDDLEYEEIVGEIATKQLKDEF